MLLTREEMSFPFGGAKLSPKEDKDIIAWMLSQFLYGEVTGIQVGHWLYEAPDMASAKFLARQSLEEMQHVDNFLRMLHSMDMRPEAAHPMVRFLSTVSDSWAEHVCLEMAAGEGFVLVAFYALIDILDHKQSVDVLNRAVRQEERHVDFGEQETMKAISGKPALARRLLGQNLVSLWAVKRLASFMAKRLPKDHPVMRQLPEFLAHTNSCAELRLQRMGISKKPLGELSWFKKTTLITEAYVAKIPGALWSLLCLPGRTLHKIFVRKSRLTQTYLADPHIKNLAQSE